MRLNFSDFASLALATLPVVALLGVTSLPATGSKGASTPAQPPVRHAEACPSLAVQMLDWANAAARPILIRKPTMEEPPWRI